MLVSISMAIGVAIGHGLVSGRGELIGGSGARSRKSYMFMAHLHRGVVSRTFPI